MPALSELWGMDAQSLDTFIRARHHRIRRAKADCNCRSSVLLGDRMLAGVCQTATHSVEVAAPAARAWPWVAQLMRGAGIYGWEALETPECRSATHLLDDVPEPRPGDQVSRCFILAAVEPGREIVWAAAEPLTLLGHEISALTLNYMVKPITEERCEIVARLRFASPGMTEQVALLLCGVLDVLLIRSQVSRLGKCIEAAEKRASPGEKWRGVHQHPSAALRPALNPGSFHRADKLAR